MILNRSQGGYLGVKKAKGLIEMVTKSIGGNSLNQKDLKNSLNSN
jgi:hypothetical protein